MQPRKPEERLPQELHWRCFLRGPTRWRKFKKRHRTSVERASHDRERRVREGTPIDLHQHAFGRGVQRFVEQHAAFSVKLRCNARIDNRDELTEARDGVHVPRGKSILVRARQREHTNDDAINANGSEHPRSSTRVGELFMQDHRTPRSSDFARMARLCVKIRRALLGIRQPCSTQ